MIEFFQIFLTKTQKFTKGFLNCRRWRRQELLSACVSMWTESHKICRVWTFIKQVLPQYFRSYGLFLNKSNYQVKQNDISESTDFKQTISMNRFCPIEALIFIQYFFCSTHVRRVCYANNWKAWHLRCSILKLLMIIEQLKSNLQQLKINCVTEGLISLSASKICKKTNLQKTKVIWNVSRIFLARVNVWTKVLRKNFSLIHQ